MQSARWIRSDRSCSAFIVKTGSAVAARRATICAAGSSSVGSTESTS
jgi:hypothetical protein